MTSIVPDTNQHLSRRGIVAVAAGLLRFVAAGSAGQPPLDRTENILWRIRAPPGSNAA